MLFGYSLPLLKTESVKVFKQQDFVPSVETAVLTRLITIHPGRVTTGYIAVQ